jgi:hypothetical protein
MFGFGIALNCPLRFVGPPIGTPALSITDADAFGPQVSWASGGLTMNSTAMFIRLGSSFGIVIFANLPGVSTNGGRYSRPVSSTATVTPPVPVGALPSISAITVVNSTSRHIAGMGLSVMCGVINTISSACPLTGIVIAEDRLVVAQEFPTTARKVDTSVIFLSIFIMHPYLFVTQIES